MCDDFCADVSQLDTLRLSKVTPAFVSFRNSHLHLSRWKEHKQLTGRNEKSPEIDKWIRRYDAKRAFNGEKFSRVLEINNGEWKSASRSRRNIVSPFFPDILADWSNSCTLPRISCIFYMNYTHFRETLCLRRTYRQENQYLRSHLMIFTVIT